mgnify:CR=1 FL=1
MQDKDRDLSGYRLSLAQETLANAKLCMDNQFYRDCINRSYYAAFYAIKAVLATESVDFKRHKDAVGYFNKKYVATGIFSREAGKRLGKWFERNLITAIFLLHRRRMRKSSMKLLN